MRSTLSQSLAGLALISSAFATPVATGTYDGTYAPATTGTYLSPNATRTNGTSHPPAYAVTPVPMESYVPGPCLQPAVHWDHPVGDLDQLAPTSANSLYYASNGTADPAVAHMFASMNTTSNYSSVVLGHSSYVQSVSCAADGVLVTFTDADGFNYAANAWPQQGTDFVLVTYTDGCGNSTDQRTFWLIDSLTYLNDTNSIDAKVTRELGVEDVFNEVHMLWGKYEPAPNATTVAKRGGSKTVSATANINLSAPTGDSSPWGGAALLFEEPGKVSVSNTSGSAIDTDFKIFCVNCGVQSHFTLQGEAAWSYLPPKITKLTAEIDANIVANFHLGLVATAEFDDTKTKNLFNQAVPDLGFSVGGVFEAGVYVTVDAVANIDITAEGQAMAGVTMTIPDFKASLDMLSTDSGSNSKMSGLTPQWEKTFDVAGALGAKATLALPIGLHLGVKIIKIFDKSIALVEQPSLSAQAQIAGSVGGAAAPGVTCNDGVSYSIDAHNDVTLNLFDIKTFNLEHADWNILSGCKQLPQATTSHTVTSSTEAPKATTPAAEKTTTTAGAVSHTSETHSGSSTHSATVPLGTAHSKTILPTGASTGGPIYGGSNKTLHTPTIGTGASSAPHATATGSGSVPVYGSNETMPTYHHGTGVSTHPEPTATHLSVSAYHEKNSTATETASIKTSTELSSTAAATTKSFSASTTAAPGYGAEASSTFATVTKPAAYTNTDGHEQAHSTTTSAASSSTSSAAKSSSTDTCTDELAKSTATTTKAPKTTAEATTKHAKATSIKFGY